jgi:alpha-ribazole phosphatase CobZ
MKICIDDVNIQKDQQTMVINREKGFFTIGNTTIGEGLDQVNSIVYHGLNNQIHPVSYDNEEINEYDLVKERTEYLKAVLNFKGIEEPVASILSPSKNFEFENITNAGVTVLASVYKGDKLFLNILVLIDHELNSRTMVKLYKSIVESKLAAMWDMGVINHFSFDPMDMEDDESILMASKGITDDLNIQLTEELNYTVQRSVREAVKNALLKSGFPKGVLDYMKDVGVEVDDLVNAGMELIVGVTETQEIREKLKKQIYHSLEDLNVVSFIIAGIRLEEDYEKHRVRGVDVDDDPAYLYSDEVFGMSVANQIAGTKAIFNFKRYDEAKPGVISELGPVLDDIFAGLIAGCMSKIFEV